MTLSLDSLSGINAVVNVNGEITTPDRAMVPVFDRGFLYGDSLYEVVRTHGGVFLHLDEHFERLKSSAKLCHLEISQDTELLRREILRTHEAFSRKNPGQDVYCRLILTRGAGKIGFGLDAVLTPSIYVIIQQPLVSPTEEQFKKGMSLQIARRLRNDPRALDPAMKSGNYLNCVLAFLEAKQEGFDDALLCNSEGHLTEGTTFNIFYVKDGKIITPPLDIGILDGITRREVLRLGLELGLETVETRFDRASLLEADEVFVTGTVKEVYPVTRVDRTVISGGAPGPVTRKLYQAYRGLIASLVSSRKSK